jgi:hypothetical protein
MTFSTVFSQDSPGPLSRAHAALSGAGDCRSCHVGGSTIGARCIDCHREIDDQLERSRGLHGRERLQECEACHPEHAGADFELIDWGDGGQAGFDHTRTRWPLSGAHAKLGCRTCHDRRYQQRGELRLVERRQVGRSWLGLDGRCAVCHADPHTGSLGDECADCHAARAWKPASRFDHDTTVYPLLGKHADLQCASCHLVPGRVESRDERGRIVPRYRPVAHAECSDCHEDPHADRLGPHCASCHVVQGFDRFDPRGFDHSRTRYPLDGRHARVECASCHDPATAWGKRPAFDSCGVCHLDAHAGQARIAGGPADCSACHGVTGFRPSTYTVAQHATARYPLEGRHREVECVGCHVRRPAGVQTAGLGPARVLMAPAHETCRDCHQDAHAGQLDGSTDGGACEGCHVVQGWKPSTYDAVRHAALRLPLDGRHAEIECSACHAMLRDGLPPFPDPRTLGSARVALALVGTACASCHHDPHGGRFADAGERLSTDACRSCHGTDRFRPATVDVARHADFEYPLEGGHRTVPCADCHAELRLPPPVVRLLTVEGRPRKLRFAAEHGRCVVCHASPHGEQFAAREEACESCHTVDSFRPATGFDHDRDSSFPLEGAHRDAACTECHPSRTDDSGSVRVTYTPLSHACRDCHDPNIAPLGRLGDGE